VYEKETELSQITLTGSISTDLEWCLVTVSRCWYLLCSLWRNVHQMEQCQDLMTTST